MLWPVFTEPVRRTYRAPMCSLSFCFSLLVLVGMILVPLFVGLASNNFWLKTNVLYEQPDVQFNYDVIVVLQGYSGGSDVETWAWATRPEVRDVYQPYLRAPIVRAWSDNTNNDDLPDVWKVSVQMPLQENDKVLSVKAMSFFNYKLKGAALLDMDAAAYIEYSSGLPGLGLLVDGEARLHQRRPLSVRRENRYPENQFARSNPQGQPRSMSSESIEALMTSYVNRNFTMELANTYSLWQTAASLDTFSVTADSFLLNFTMRVPVDEVVYTPDLPEVLKVAWVQYFALAFLFYILFELLKSFVFTNQVLETVVSKEGATKFSKIKQHRF